MRTLSFLIFLVFGLGSYSWAAENDLPGAEDSSTAEENGAQEVDPADSEDLILSDEELEEEGPRRFIPTEQISQDLGVSFPVDI